MAGTVLFRRSALGDVVMLGAVTGQLERPVTVVTDPRWRQVAAALPGVDAVIDWPDTPEGLPPGRWIDLQASGRSRRLTGNVARIDKRSVRRRLRQWLGPIVRPRPSVPALYAEACGTSPSAAPWITGEPTRDTLVILPGAAWATKRWSVASFRTVVQAWDGPVVVLGGPGDEARCRAVAEGSRAEILVEAGFTSTLRALRRAAVAVGGDTGLTHLAAACGARVIGVFLSTDPGDGFWPWTGPAIHRELPCRPCTLHGRSACPLGDFACSAIDPQAVVRALRASSPRS